MAYPQPHGMFSPRSWGGSGSYNWGGGGYGAQAEGGGSSPAASWYQGGRGDMSQNPAYRGANWGGHPQATPATPAVPGATPATPAIPPNPNAQPASPISPTGQPYHTPTGAPWDPNFVNPNPMNLGNPLAAALAAPRDRFRPQPDMDGNGTSAGVIEFTNPTNYNTLSRQDQISQYGGYLPNGQWQVGSVTPDYVYTGNGNTYSPTSAQDAQAKIQELINAGAVNGIMPGQYAY